MNLEEARKIVAKYQAMEHEIEEAEEYQVALTALAETSAMPLCGGCQTSIDTTVDVWVRTMTHYGHFDGEGHNAREFEISDAESGGCDYVSVCVECWKAHLLPLWRELVDKVQRVGPKA